MLQFIFSLSTEHQMSLRLLCISKSLLLQQLEAKLYFPQLLQLLFTLKMLLHSHSHLLQPLEPHAENGVPVWKAYTANSVGYGFVLLNQLFLLLLHNTFIFICIVGHWRWRFYFIGICYGNSLLLPQENIVSFATLMSFIL